MLTVAQYPNKNFITYPFFPVAKINIARTIKRSYLAPGEELTHEKALTIFRDMKWRSDFKATILHPVTLLTIGLSGIMPHLFFTATGILNIAIRVAFSISAISLGFCFDMFMMQRDWEKSYWDQSKMLAYYIRTLENNPSKSVKLEYP